MADLEWTTENNTPAQVIKELLHEETIPAEEKILYRIGSVEDYDEFQEIVPASKQWAVITSIRVIETDV